MYFLMEWLRGFYEGQIAVVLLVNTLLMGGYGFLIYLFEKPLILQARGR